MILIILIIFKMLGIDHNNTLFFTFDCKTPFFLPFFYFFVNSKMTIVHIII
jgi:hypothetical protein